jgi:hypothetical protein
MDLVGNTGLFLGRYMLGSCAFVSWNSRHILIGDRIKSSHLEYVEIIDNIEEILCYVNYTTGL